MDSTLYIALSRQASLRREMAVIAENIANMNTTAFKGEKVMFVDYLQKSRGDERLLPDRVAYVRDLAQMRDVSVGPIQLTHNPLDVAIHGEGYFSVETERGVRYTRDGHFTLDSGGRLVTKEGYPVLSEGGAPITFAPTDTQIDIAADGTVSTENGAIGKIGVFNIENEQRMTREANNLYNAGDDDPDVVADARVEQGAVEGSNVNPIIEMTRMIEVQRAYEGAKTFIDQEDKRKRSALSLMVGRNA